MNQVSILSTPSYELETVEAAVSRHFALLGLEGLVRPGMRVVLKPNLLMKRTPKEATTTHPALVQAVARWCRARGAAEILLADSPGGPYTRTALGGIYRATGMEEAAAQEGFALNWETGWSQTPCAGSRVREFPLIDPIVRADLVINLCKLKTHCMTGLSGGVKNLFGCVPGLQKPEFHYRFKNPEEFCDMLVDLCEAVRPAVTLVDAVDAMEGNGPSGGTPVHLGVTLCSASPYALDLALCRLIRMPFSQAGTVKASQARGLAPRWEDVELLGRPELLGSAEGFRLPQSMPVDFNRRLPKWLQGAADGITDRFFVPRPVIRRKACIGCGKCAESCPAHTIQVTGGKARILDRQCIRCYCCHEMCPVKAIYVRRSRLLRL